MKDDANNDCPIDFSAIDPSVDRARWESLIERVVSGSAARRVTLADQTASWALWAFAASLLACALAWILTSDAVPERQGPSAGPGEAASLLCSWAEGDGRPDMERFLRALQHRSAP